MTDSLTPAPVADPVTALPVVVQPPPAFDSSELMMQAMTPTTMKEAIDLAEFLAASDFVPKGLKGKPSNVLLCMQIAAQFEMSLLSALQNVAVINGKPSMYGDALLGVVRASPLCISVHESFDEDTMTAQCTTVRRGEEAPITRRFSQHNAEQAKLWGKDGPWRTYPQRMLQMRARSWALRDAFPDVTMGMIAREEAEDFVVGKARVVASEPTTRPAVQPKSEPVSDMAERKKIFWNMKEAMAAHMIGEEDAKRIANDALGYQPDSLRDLSTPNLDRVLQALRAYRSQPVGDSGSPVDPDRVPF
jgi:hypothetical protein